MMVSFPGLGWDIALDRVAFSIGDFSVYWYGIIIALGLFSAVMFAYWKARDFGIDMDRLLDVVIIAAIVSVIGARLYYVLFSADFRGATFGEIINIRDGGLGFYGALIFALVSAYFLCRWRRIKYLPVADMTAIGFLVGQGIGRWGNFFNQEAFGTNTKLPWGMLSEQTTRYLSSAAGELAAKGVIVYPDQPVHPTFLYESLWCLLGFVLLTLYIKRRRFDGEIVLMYIVWNGAVRAIIEGLRTDSLYLGSIRISQLLAAVAAVLAAAAIVLIRVKIAQKADPEYLKPYGKTEAWEAELAELQNKRAAEKEQKKAGQSADAGPDAGAEPDEPEKQEKKN